MNPGLSGRAQITNPVLLSSLQLFSKKKSLQLQVTQSWTWIRMINPSTESKGSQITPCSAAVEIDFHGTCCLCQNESYMHQVICGGKFLSPRLLLIVKTYLPC